MGPMRGGPKEGELFKTQFAVKNVPFGQSEFFYESTLQSLAADSDPVEA